MKQESFKIARDFSWPVQDRCTGSLEILGALWRLVEHFGLSVPLQTESEVFQAGHPKSYLTPQVLFFTFFLNGLNEISNKVFNVFSQCFS